MTLKNSTGFVLLTRFMQNIIKLSQRFKRYRANKRFCPLSQW